MPVLKVLVLCEMNSEKVLTIIQFGRYSLKMSVLLDINSGKCVVLFATNSLKMLVLLDNDMKSGKVCSIVCQ